MSEILSQAEIDALLNMMGNAADDAGAWQPGEQEAISRVGVLIAEAASVTWQSRFGPEYRVSPPSVEQSGPADAEASVAGPGLWVVARLAGAMQGHLAFWAGGAVGAALAEKILGQAPGDRPLSEDELSNLALGITTFFGPLAEALGELAQGPVTVEASGEQWAAGPEPGGVLKSLLGESTRVVRMEFATQFGGAAGPVLCFWPLPDARAFLSRIAPAGEPAPVPAASVAAAPRPAREDVHEAEFQPLESGGVRQVPQNIDLLLDVPLVLTVELGRTEKQIREILALGPGSVIELDRLAGEAVDVLVNGKLIAKGEVVVVDENFGIRITDIVSRAERLSKLR